MGSVSANVVEWLNSGEYRVEIDETRTAIMRDSLASKTESQTASVFESELYFLIRNKTGIKLSYSKEKSVSPIKHKFGSLRKRKSGTGRLDAVVNSLVIEYKHHAKLNTKEQFQKAAQQTVDYLNALYTAEKYKYSAILTDGIRISYFVFVGDEVHYSSLSPLSNNDIDTIVKAILTNDKKRFVPENIVKDFSVSPTVSSVSKSIASILYDTLKRHATEKTHMLYEEWKNLMHLSVDDNGKGNDIAKRRSDLSLIFADTINSPEAEYRALYALQTTYAIIVKLIACKVVDKLEYNRSAKHFYDLTSITSEELRNFFEKMEDGYSYRSSQIFNFLEGDFYSWYADKKQWSANFWKLALEVIETIDQYSSFSFNITYQPIDIFKDLYMGIIPRSIRHSMGEYFTPEWLADHVVSESLSMIPNKNWKAIDPCCGSGIFVISLIKKIVGNINIQSLSEPEKQKIRDNIISRVYGIDINPLSVLSARVGYYLALLPLGQLSNVEIPVYLGDSAIIPAKETIGGIKCYKYSISNQKSPFDIVLPERFVKRRDFGKVMSQLQSCVKTGDETILYTALEDKLSERERKSVPLTTALKSLAHNLTELHKNNWDGIWIRIATNFMLIARLDSFDLIVGNPPWVKWEHLPAMYASRIKELCTIKHIFSNDGQFGGTQLNICALISNVTASNWLNKNGVLAFLMPDSIMSQNSYEWFRRFYIDYEQKSRLYLQCIDKWESPLRPFRCDNKPITQDFNTYYFSSAAVNYKDGIPVRIISRKKDAVDLEINRCSSFEAAKAHLIFREGRAVQLSENSTAFSYISDKYDFSEIIGPTSYLYRTGVEFTPQELYMLTGAGTSVQPNHYRFISKKFQLSKYRIEDTPANGWDLPVEFIYPIVTGPDIEPFRYRRSNDFCVLPYGKSDTSKPVGIKKMVAENNELFDYLVSHRDLIDQQSEKSKQMHRGDAFYALSKIGPYTFAKNIVAARDNSKFCASVIKKALTPWNQFKQTICVKHTIIISQDKTGRFISSAEANYICGILNSDIVISYIHSSFKTNGFSLNKSNLYLPLYDSTNPIHKKISAISLRASKGTGDTTLIQKRLSDLYLELCRERNKTNPSEP